MSKIFDKFLGESKLAGWARVLFVLILLVLTVFLGCLFLIPEGESPWIIFSIAGFQYWIFPLAALISAMLIAANYIRRIYQLPNLRLAFQYLVSIIFRFRLPSLRVKEGKISKKPEDVNLLELVGGPGYISVSPDSLVLVEGLNGSTRVLGSGMHSVRRSEAIKGTISLEDQLGLIGSVSATTKDGIVVIVRDIAFRYRLRSDRQAGDSQASTSKVPFPYSSQAMLNYIYNRTVTLDGLVTFDNVINFFIEGELKNYIYSHKYDQITSPAPGADVPRLEIRRRFDSKGVRDKFKEVGVELLWIDIGHFDVADERVWQQKVDTWQAKWIGNAEYIRAYGEAQRMAYHEQGRSEAQAEMLMSIIHALDGVKISSVDSREYLRNLILLRTAQILEAMTEHLPEQTVSGFLPDKTT